MNVRLQWTFLCLIPLLIFTACNKRKNTHDSDAQLQQKLVGSWELFYTPVTHLSNFSSQLTVDPTGIYHDHCEGVSYGTERIFDIVGTYRITNGWLLDTMTDNSMQTNKQISPHTSSNRIVRLTESEWALDCKEYSESETNLSECIWHRIKK